MNLNCLSSIHSNRNFLEAETENSPPKAFFATLCKCTTAIRVVNTKTHAWLYPNITSCVYKYPHGHCSTLCSWFTSVWKHASPSVKAHFTQHSLRPMTPHLHDAIQMYLRSLCVWVHLSTYLAEAFNDCKVMRTNTYDFGFRVLTCHKENRDSAAHPSTLPVCIGFRDATVVCPQERLMKLHPH